MISIVKLGGSIISPDKNNFIDFDTVINLKNSLSESISAGNKFYFSVGGGYLCRFYQDMMRNNLHKYTDYDLHRLGVAAINMNAEVVRTIFGEIADTEIYKYNDFDESVKFSITNSVKVGAAGNPGHSSDYNAALAAIKLGSKVIYSMKNVDGVYTADPKKDSNAKKIDKLSWDEYLDIIKVTVHAPGANHPVDPIASRIARDNGIKFIILSDDVSNLINAIYGRAFEGSVIEG